MTLFSDLHYGENSWDLWGPQQDVNSAKLMRIILADEQPDCVVLNGDLITGENTFIENSTSLIDEIMAPLNEARVPFSFMVRLACTATGIRASSHRIQPLSW
ncbi:hypothetical protein PILCRDRAFT_584819 [Piloderma croceum F 1598]|uniref:Calcineurin-like phosphoesterase domain-containing protein n=1 Tax=Piloderma croceum (strain F 1598) TaxID=765440 RepID=A0A0C3BMQ9_PILCF|nr:hypothetical protein PILCRDRAFT_584819 [Piloderma croceum F 1598]